MKTGAIALALVVGLASSRAPLGCGGGGGASHPTSSTKPTWCDPEQTNYDSASVDDAFKPDAAMQDVMFDVVAMRCKPEDSEGAQEATPKLEALRQQMSQKLGMTDADWKDAAAYVKMGAGSRYGAPILRDADRKSDLAKFDPIDQFVALSDTNSLGKDPNYYADMFGAKLSELGRLGYITACLGGGDNPMQWAVCQGDIDAFDAKKAFAEVTASKNPDGHKRMLMRFLIADLPAKLQKHQEVVKALFAKDDAYAKLFELAKQGRARFTKEADPKFVELAYTMDAARIADSRKAFAGCEATTWQGFVSIVQGLGAKAFETVPFEWERPEPDPLTVAIGIIIASPNGYLATAAYVMCAKGGEEQPSQFVQNMASRLVDVPGLRGPRTTAEMTALFGNVQLDNKSDTIDHHREPHQWFTPPSSSDSEIGTGPISDVEIKGDKATVSWVKKMEQQSQCQGRKQTNRVLMVDPAGHLIYDSVCIGYKTVTVNVASDPVEIQKEFLGGLKKGMVGLVGFGTVMLAYPKTGVKVPSIVVGVPVK